MRKLRQNNDYNINGRSISLPLQQPQQQLTVVTRHLQFSGKPQNGNQHDLIPRHQGKYGHQSVTRLRLGVNVIKVRNPVFNKITVRFISTKSELTI